MSKLRVGNNHVYVLVEFNDSLFNLVQSVIHSSSVETIFSSIFEFWFLIKRTVSSANILTENLV